MAARTLKVSRSQLYATALAEFLERNGRSDVTQRLNAIYEGRPARVDPLLSRMQRGSLPKENW